MLGGGCSARAGLRGTLWATIPSVRMCAGARVAAAHGVRGTQLPQWAAEVGLTSWAQFFLAWILGHPAVTCPIPATSNPAHLADVLQGGTGPLPDAMLRGKMRALLEAL